MKQRLKIRQNLVPNIHGKEDNGELCNLLPPMNYTPEVGDITITGISADSRKIQRAGCLWRSRAMRQMAMIISALPLPMVRLRFGRKR